ncbi:MAG: hypothetical protein Q7S74_01900 [Nanoarchaeota archaeon]|nr:hypothetical protein [Nanoarchaeota archaeon]
MNSSNYNSSNLSFHAQSVTALISNARTHLEQGNKSTAQDYIHAARREYQDHLGHSTSDTHPTYFSAILNNIKNVEKELSK